VDVNVITVSGNIVADPVFKTLGSGTEMVNFSIANNRKYKEKWVNFFNCVAWGGTAKIINQYCRKGKGITVVGEMKQDRWEDKDGKKQSRISINVKEVILAPKNTGTDKPDNPTQGNDVSSTTDSFEDQQIFEDDDIPF